MCQLLDVAPVREIQRAYFALLRSLFGKPFEEMTKHGLSPAAIASHMSGETRLVEAFASERLEFLQAFIDFWHANHVIVDTYLRSVVTMKSQFGGDISPIVDLKHFSSTLLYTDTVILQCPLLRLSQVISIGDPANTFRLVVKHALNVMRFEKLALADVEPPLLVMTGSHVVLDEEYQENLVRQSDTYVLAHAETLFGRSFSTFIELQNYLKEIKTARQAVEVIANPSRALFDTEWRGSLEEQLTRSSTELVAKIGIPEELRTVGFTLHNTTSGRMLQANEVIMASSLVGASPLISAPTSWQYLLWRYEYDAKLVYPELDSADLVISNAILTRGERDEVTLISGLSIESIVALRKEGALDALRALMRKAVKQLDSATPTDLRLVSGQLSRELGEAFDRHEQELSDVAARKRRFFGVDIGSSLVTGALTIAGAATGNIPLTAFGAVSTSILGATSVPAIWKNWKDIQSQQEQLKRSPAAILMRDVSK
jgi:hypothetical protein